MDTTFSDTDGVSQRNSFIGGVNSLVATSSSSVGLITKFLSTTVVDPETLPDPHFKTFGNEWFDFHGQCDLVLLDIPNFEGGVGLKVHIRTTVRASYSFIETAAIQIGEDVFEASSFGARSLNGVTDVELPAMISGYPVTEILSNKKKHHFYVNLGDERHFTIKVYKDMVSFSFHLPEGKDKHEFDGTAGLLGHYKTGARLARDGATLIEDPIEFGKHWQVNPVEDGRLFMAERHPQYPVQCIMPNEAERTHRRLNGSISTDAAAMACARVPEGEVRDMCIFDVLSTQDLSVADSGAY